METLQEIIEQATDEIIIIDSGNTGVNHLDRELYDCAEEISLPHERFLEALLKISEIYFLVEQNQIYVVPGTIQEMQECLDNLNKDQRFHTQRAEGHVKFRRGKRFKPHLDEEEKKADSKNRGYLARVTKNLMSLIRLVEKRNIVEIFSEQESKEYTALFESLKNLKDPEGNPLKRSYTERYETELLRSPGPLNLDTEEQTVSAAIMQANKSPIIITTHDSSIRRILRQGLRSKNISDYFWQLYPRQGIKIYADYEGNGFYNLVFDSDNPELCEKEAERSTEWHFSRTE